MRNNFFIENMVQKVSRGGSTSFLTLEESHQVLSILRKKKINHQIFKPFEECEKTIIYQNNFPKVNLYEILSKEPLKHSDILGALYPLQIDFHYFGDIIAGSKSYIYLLEDLENYIINTLTYVGKQKISFKRIDLDTLSTYQREYEEISYPIASPRIDLVFSKITHINRSKIYSFLHQKEIIVNENYISKSSYLLKEGDLFSIRKYGKYKVEEIIKTKNNHRIYLKKYK